MRHFSVRPAAYERMLRAAGERGISVARLVELAVEPILGPIEPLAPFQGGREFQNITVSDDLYDRLTVEGARRNMSRAALVEAALAEALGTAPVRTRGFYRARQEATSP